ncbi:FliM/FliN family flagellar motor switch protein [Pseudomonas uvaldensis]|uniref:FliM/FliN family flagellar motor switch protein n=1 Tax=Pseudomonas uvaldensis TaxID=2878385 RepID=UPI001E553446|nr:FliM/FliN family flagellar motor C-terminal domain-containing protein [Pseudomonas uvaldensis]MCE0460987.1 FliM/FliN family flagellar motor C-terminal domain-containing protein [Pseudomonas uvaldensis]
MRMLGFVGAIRLRTACDRLPPVALRWYERWCFSDGHQTCNASCSALNDNSELASTRGWLSADSVHGSVSLTGDWQSLIFGSFSHDVPDDEVSRHLLQEAQLALINDLLEALGHSHVSLLAAAPQKPYSNVLSAQVLLQLCVGQLTLHVLLDAALLNAGLKPFVARNSLVERKQALGNARVKLSVCLPMASLSIGEMQDLHPGDTLRSSALLFDPVSLQLAEGTVVADGYLARQDDHLAVQLIPNTTSGAQA